MALSLPRHRGPAASDQISPSPVDLYSKEDKGRKEGGGLNEAGLRWQLPFLVLGLLRHMSASSNIIHDCDEVFKYWEPLHYLLYKSGFQTWEYSSEFALRSYLYLFFFHMLVAGPTSFFYKEEKIQVFYKLRLFLGLISTITETVLVVALSRKYGKIFATYTLAMLCLTSGCFFSSTSFLPSTFSIICGLLSLWKMDIINLQSIEV